MNKSNLHFFFVAKKTKNKKPNPHVKPLEKKDHQTSIGTASIISSQTVKAAVFRPL